MSYVLDVSCLDAYSSGAKQRFINLYSELIKLNKKKNFLIIYSKEYQEVKQILDYPNVKFKENPISQENYLIKLFSIIYISAFTLFKIKKVKVIEFFTLPFLRLGQSKNVFTIHDLRKVYFSEFFLNKLAFKFFFSFFLKKVDEIIVVSNAMKAEMQKMFGKLNITTIYNTINVKDFKNVSKKNINSIRYKYKLPKKFILSVGHLEKRKNYLRLIKSIYILKKSNYNVNLIIIGQKADETDNIKKLIKTLKLKSNIKVFSNLDDNEVKCFYKIADLFVFPSLYEGFGIPIIESMAADLPIVLSNSDVFREITENKYSYFDQYDPLSIANKIKFVLGTKDLQKKMILYGRKRVKYFSLNIQKKKLDKFYNNLN